MRADPRMGAEGADRTFKTHSWFFENSLDLSPADSSFHRMFETSSAAKSTKESKNAGATNPLAWSDRFVHRHIGP
ncbi:MAG TPA: hypothetical protein VMZ27_07695, partial [Candidatus Saccharimonadales bacterium]|nr:hypothetical protein [Candidatus Saccharimonadales bacterium]